MLQRIKHIINEEAQFQKGSMNMKRQRCFAVKADINPILDIARKAYCDLIDDINSNYEAIFKIHASPFSLNIM